MAEAVNASLAPNIDYAQTPFRSGVLQFQTVQSNQFGSPINLNTSQIPVVFNLPTEVMNLAESVLAFTVNISAPTVNNYIWTYADVIGEISHIQLYGTNNMFIADLDNLNKYSKFVIQREMSLKEYLTNDPMNKFCQSNSLANVVPALRCGNSLVAAETGPNPAALNYLEMAHFNVGAISAAVTYNVQLPLKFLKNTILAMNKNIYFDSIAYLKVFFGPISNVCYMSTSNANPSAGVVGAYTVLAGQPTPFISNLQLYLAIETEHDERARLINQVQTSGLSMMIPYVQCYKNSNSGPTQNINLQLDSSCGRMVSKIYHSIFANSEALDSAYDNSNNPQNAGSLQTQKVNQYYTQYNGRRLQNISIDATSPAFTDYMMQKTSLRGSLLENLSLFQYSWHHLDDFSGLSADYVHGNKDDLVSGRALGPVPVTWTFNGINMRATAAAEGNSFQHYTFGVFMKQLKIMRGQIEVS